MEKEIQQIINDHIETAKGLIRETKTIEDIAAALINCLKSGGKILICGNGGSAADSQHMAAELIGRFKKSERIPLPAIALTTDTSIITAIGNDFGIKHIFSKQIAALGKKDDVLILISTSGNSENLINAVKTADKLQIKPVGLLGKDGGQLKKMLDLFIIASSTDTARIQESHSLIIHTLCELIENSLSKGFLSS